MIRCVGHTFADKAFLIKCDCGQCIMEIGYCQKDNRYSFEGYIHWLSPLYTKYKYSDVWFNNQLEFEKFLECIQNMIDHKEYKKEIFYSYGVVGGESQILGRLEVEYDEYNYLNFCFYKREKPKARGVEKPIWVLYLSEKDQKELYSRCEEFLYQLQTEEDDNENA